MSIPGHLSWSLIVALASHCAAPGLSATHELATREGKPGLTLTVGKTQIVSPTGRPIYSASACRVMVKPEPIAEGSLIHVSITNDTGAPADMPDLAIGGVRLPVDGVEIIENWKNIRKAGFTVGFWWGRAFSPSAGHDSGVRVPMDPDDPELVAASFRELDAAYSIGVRLIGCDASPHSIFPTHWRPSVDVLQNKWFPMLYKRYPDVQWVIETAANDFQHVWGSSFMWSREVTGPCTFADYVVPGSETNVTIKKRYGRTDQEWLDQLIQWEYTPIVFNSRFGLKVKRELLALTNEQ